MRQFAETMHLKGLTWWWTRVAKDLAVDKVSADSVTMFTAQ